MQYYETVRAAAKAAMVRSRQAFFSVEARAPASGSTPHVTLDEARAEVPSPLMAMFNDRVATHTCHFRVRGTEVYPELAFSVTCAGMTSHYYTDGTRDDILLAGVTSV